MVQQKDQRKKGYNTFRFDPYPNQRVGLKKETNNNTILTSKRKSNVNLNGQCSSSLSTVGRLVSTSGKGINRKRLSCDNLSEINRINSLSVNNLNSLNSTTSVSTITLNTIPSTTNELTNKRGLSSLEPCCLCCTPRTKLTKNNSTTNLRHQSRNNRASNQKLDDSRKNLNSLKDEDEESNQLERYVPSQELYKKLVKEHLQLQSSFKILCQRLEEEKERSVTESNEKQSLKEEINNMMRKVDLLAMELQEARDQNELMEFRILESEQSKATFPDETTNLIKCDKAIQLEPLKEVDEEEVGKRGSLILPPAGSSVKMKADHSNELFLYGLTGKRSAVSFGCLPGGKTHKSCSSLESYGLTLSLTSEDEGLGDDGRRDQFSGPSSLSDMQMSDEESTGSTGSSSKSTDAAIQTSSSSSSSQIDSLPVSIATDSTAVVGTLITSPCRYCKESTKLEDKVNLLMEERDNLQEQVLELEEAENDARLVSQRLQRQVENLVNQVDCLQISLGKANQQIDHCNETIHTLREGELKLKVDFMMALIAKSEDSPSKLLDELKTKLKEKKNELASMGPMVFSSLNTFDDRSFDSPSSTTTFNGSSPSSANRHNFKQAIYNQQQQQHANSFNQQYQPYLQLTSFNGGPDDCEIFVPEDSLPPDPGSSFHVQMLTSSRYNNNCRPSQSTTSTFSPTSRSSQLPLCETVKPKKIDLLLSSSSPTYSSSSSPPLSTSSSPLVSPASSSSSSSNLSSPSPLSPSSPPLLSTVMLPSNPVNQIN